jgi:hypothetical protein
MSSYKGRRWLDAIAALLVDGLVTGRGFAALGPALVRRVCATQVPNLFSLSYFTFGKYFYNEYYFTTTLDILPNGVSSLDNQ